MSCIPPFLPTKSKMFCISILARAFSNNEMKDLVTLLFVESVSDMRMYQKSLFVILSVIGCQSFFTSKTNRSLSFCCRGLWVWCRVLVEHHTHSFTVSATYCTFCDGESSLGLLLSLHLSLAFRFPSVWAGCCHHEDPIILTRKPFDATCGM